MQRFDEEASEEEETTRLTPEQGRVDVRADLPNATLPHQQQHGGGGGDDEADGTAGTGSHSSGMHTYLVGNVRLEFYRTQLSRVLMVVAVLALPALYLSPILGLLLFPSSLLTLYWLRDNVRFTHGGDVRRCVTRDCAAMFLQICSAAAWIISCIDVVVICYELSHPGQDSETAQTVHRHVTATSAQPKFMRVVQLLLNLALVVLLVATIHFCHNLRKILNSVPSDVVHA